MGFKISYIITPIAPRDLVRPLGFGLGVETDALPYDEWWVGTLKTNGQSVLWSETLDFVADVDAELTALSNDADIVACRVDEDAQVCAAVYYQNGHRKWEISCGASAESLVATGDLPDPFADILKNHGDKPQMIPIETVAAVSGFQYDIDLMNRRFSRFFRITADQQAAAPNPPKGFIAKLMGR